MKLAVQGAELGVQEARNTRRSVGLIFFLIYSRSVTHELGHAPAAAAAPS